MSVRTYDKTIYLQRLPAGFDGLRIAHVSDLHLGGLSDLARRAADALSTIRADLVVITGDIATHGHAWPSAARGLRHISRHIRAPLGTYAILGNHDTRWGSHSVDGNGVTFLINQSATLHRNGTTLQIVGCYNKQPHNTDLPQALMGLHPGTCTVLLSHYPSVACWAEPAGIDLVLAGHTHGGQVRLPGIRWYYANDPLGCAHAQGLSRVGRTQLFVTRGIGYSGFARFRLLCPAEIPVLELRTGTAGPSPKRKRREKHS